MKRQDKVYFYRDKQKKYRWRKTASNGRVLCTPNESFNSHQDCVHNAKRSGVLAMNDGRMTIVLYARDWFPKVRK